MSPYPIPFIRYIEEGRCITWRVFVLFFLLFDANSRPSSSLPYSHSYPMVTAVDCRPDALRRTRLSPGEFWSFTFISYAHSYCLRTSTLRRAGALSGEFLSFLFFLNSD